MKELQPAQDVPVRIYQTEDQIMLAAPLPGLEPEDIAIQISGDRVTIDGAERGPGQHGLDLVLAEWTVGPYRREVVLPERVDGERTTATYGNGVLVLSMPRAGNGRAPAAEFRLHSTSSARGERIGGPPASSRPKGG